ncbi:MAG: DUF948 domain-containing protein [Calditrichaeota bacterium]|nr:DUF948 domain-containing protein [Calditrichota bacterium]RQW01377.1 MAG: DUF948 domain-containing protein [Calditrichota bacterium]
MLWEISLLIIAVAFLLLIIFAIPSLLQVRRTAKNLEITSKTVNQNLPGILTNLDEITTNLTQVTQSIHYQIHGIQNIVDRFQNVAEDVVDFERTLRAELESPVVETVSTISAAVKGVRAFMDTLRNRRAY